MKIEIRNNQLLINGKHAHFISGEVHYWRMNPRLWGTILNKLRDLGLEIIASYVPWEFHEYKKGNLDFTGITDPHRDLNGFLNLVKEKGLNLIIRPGPYIYSEWKNAGVTDESAKYHRMHPVAIKLAADYIKEVSGIIKPLLITNGGNIIACQADNEIDPFINSFEYQLGLDGNGGLFTEFLEEKYESIDELNKLWQTKYEKFSQARAFLNYQINDKYLFKRYYDSREFINWYVKKYSRWCIHEYKKNGIDVPFILNGYPVFSVHNYYDLQQIAEITGIDIYPTNEFSNRKNEHQLVFESLKVMKAITDFPFIMEFESGIWHGWHYTVGTPKDNHYRMTALTALAAGIKGWNWYMIVDRDNWYMSPINPKGLERRELYGAFKNIVGIFKDFNPSESIKVTSTGLTCDHNYIPELLEKDNSIRNVFYNSNIDYEFFDIESGKNHKPILFYSGHQWLSESAQSKLLEYVENGGILVFFQNFPRLNELLNKYNIFDIPDPDRITSHEDIESNPVKKFEISLDKFSCRIWGSVYIYKDTPGIPIYAVETSGENDGPEENDFLYRRPEGLKHCIGYIRDIKKGKILILGVYPNRDLILNIHKYFNIPVHIGSNIKNVFTSLFKNKNNYYVIVLNNGFEDKNIEVEITEINDLKSFSVVLDLVKNVECNKSIRDDKLYINLFIGRKDGTILKIL